MSKSSPYKKRDPKSSIWYIHWTENRVGKRISTRTTIETEADRFLANWILTEHIEMKNAADVALADVWSVYYKGHVLNNVANIYNADLAWKQLNPFFGSVAVSQLSQMKIDSYVSERTSGRRGRKVKPQTVTKELTYLLAAITYCARKNVGFLPPECKPEFDLPPQGEPQDRWLRTEEIQRLLDAAVSLRGKGTRLNRGERFIWLALETAGRKEALLDLTWDRVDFEAGIISLEVPGRRRTKKRRADVPISDALMPVLRRAYDERVSDLVLDNKAAIWATIQFIAIRAGFSDQKVKTGCKPKATGISPHVLRHTAATHMARRGVPLWIIAQILGNTVAVVEKTYAKYQPEDLRDAINQISNGKLEAAA